MELDNNNHSVFLLYYHLVLVVKYRRKVFSDQMSQYAKDIFVRIGSSYNITLEEWNHDQDHVHILFEASPQTQLSKLVNNYKTVTSRLLRKEFSSALSKYYGKPLFWSDSYFLSTVSETTEEAVRIYIQEQGKRDNDGFHRPTGRRKAADHA